MQLVYFQIDLDLNQANGLRLGLSWFKISLLVYLHIYLDLNQSICLFRLTNSFASTQKNWRT